MRRRLTAGTRADELVQQSFIAKHMQTCLQCRTCRIIWHCRIVSCRPQIARELAFGRLVAAHETASRRWERHARYRAAQMIQGALQSLTRSLRRSPFGALVTAGNRKPRVHAAPEQLATFRGGPRSPQHASTLFISPARRLLQRTSIRQRLPYSIIHLQPNRQSSVRLCTKIIM